MFGSLLFFHSLVRWVLFILMLVAVIIAWFGFRYSRPFTRSANALRHWTATSAHIQLMIGIVLYAKSPWVKLFQQSKFRAGNEAVFFGMIHISGMLVAIVLLTIGSAKAKREKTDTLKYRTMFRWFFAALILIMILIPWPFSPLSSRGLFRSY
ncbi:MAG: hypothetical protein EOO02_02180 [Chitinophagaceae bacterium]|nr:MAG: hypothetical protein EOO02_02180 [Chitinophagaceae bacterium]